MKNKWCLEKLSVAAISEQFRRELKEKDEEAKICEEIKYNINAMIRLEKILLP